MCGGRCKGLRKRVVKWLKGRGFCMCVRSGRHSNTETLGWCCGMVRHAHTCVSSTRVHGPVLAPGHGRATSSGAHQQWRTPAGRLTVSAKNMSRLTMSSRKGDGEWVRMRWSTLVVARAVWVT